MSEIESESPSKATSPEKTTRDTESKASVDGLDSDEGIVVEQVKADLIKSGVRKEQAPEIAERIVAIATASYHSGPLPVPQAFAEYNDVCPGAARDILDMAIKEQKHAHFIESSAMIGEIALKVITIIAAVLIILIMIVGAICAAIYADKTLAYEIAAGSGLALVAGPLLKGLFRHEKPDEENKKPSTPQKTRPPKKRVR